MELRECEALEVKRIDYKDSFVIRVNLWKTRVFFLKSSQFNHLRAQVPRTKCLVVPAEWFPVENSAITRTL